jgi:hypothetical protein
MDPAVVPADVDDRGALIMWIDCVFASRHARVTRLWPAYC